MVYTRVTLSPHKTYQQGKNDFIASGPSSLLIQPFFPLCVPLFKAYFFAWLSSDVRKRKNDTSAWSQKLEEPVYTWSAEMIGHRPRIF